jgi:hypothetical protein
MVCGHRKASRTSKKDDRKLLFTLLSSQGKLGEKLYSLRKETGIFPREKRAKKRHFSSLTSIEMDF